MKRAAALLLFGFILLNMAGCIPLLIGAAAGGAGAYAAGKDAIEGDLTYSFSQLWDASLKVAKIRGTVKGQDQTAGYLYLETGDGSKVWINISRVTETTTRLKVAARRSHLPKIELAQDFFAKITDQAK